MQVFSVIAKGGYVMYPIVACSVIALAVFIERWYVLRYLKDRIRKYLKAVRKALAQEDLRGILELSSRSPNPASRIILAGLRKYFKGLPREAREAMETAASFELPLLEKRLSTLVVIANISPLLGLLGTVTGMIRTFAVIAAVGVGKPTEMAGGISEALLTTAAGLSVAIPTLVMHHYLAHLVEGLVQEIERVSSEVLELIESREYALKEKEADVPVPAMEEES
ncbi:MotA/TolQ/ExbB proton channel family protein [Candidatus Caldatribacterium sp. SIUC1]|uniref:MotA/TolQ/ExbB proton channel family protein n=1 Tax=Candidatus Caldatribacterium sp. SIUC1 TaxID=3418365 RepID=UPI003F68EC5B